MVKRTNKSLSKEYSNAMVNRNDNNRPSAGVAPRDFSVGDRFASHYMSPKVFVGPRIQTHDDARMDGSPWPHGVRPNLWMKRIR